MKNWMRSPREKEQVCSNRRYESYGDEASNKRDDGILFKFNKTKMFTLIHV